MLSLMDYSILNASGEMSPLQFLHNFIHVAVCFKKKKTSWQKVMDIPDIKVLYNQ